MRRMFVASVLGVCLYGYSALALAEPANEDTAIEDTATLGDTAEDTADTSDTSDTADTADTGGDTADTSDTSDTSDTALVTPASTLANEKGGFGCSSVGVGGFLAVVMSLLGLFLRRREEA